MKKYMEGNMEIGVLMLRTKIVFSIILLLLFINFWITPVFAQNQTGSSNQYKDWVIEIKFDRVEAAV